MRSCELDEPGVKEARWARGAIKYFQTPISKELQNSTHKWESQIFICSQRRGLIEDFTLRALIAGIKGSDD